MRIILNGPGITREIECRVIQSPLAGISDQIFRNLVRKWAPNALLFTEMVNANSLELGHGREKLDDLSKEQGPVGVQLFDYRPEALSEAAKRAEGAGAFLIDINMGCPVKKIAKKGGGSALLKDPKLAEEIVSKVVNSVNIPVTVKTRLGWCNQSINPISFALGLEQAGAKLITLHGRTREQGFSGEANWEMIRKVKDVLTIPLIANGDINCPEDAFKCLEITQADGIMIGRGSLGSPWLLGQINAALEGFEPIKTPSPAARLEIALEHLENLLIAKGNHGLLVARKHLNWSCKGFDGSNEIRKSLINAKTPFDAKKILKEQINYLNKL